MSAGTAVEDLLRELAPQVLCVLVRRHGDFSACEDAVQEALLAAALQWPGHPLPENPRGWLITVGSRRMIDQLRTDRARRRRETAAASLEPAADQIVAAPAEEPQADQDDTLTLLFLCCHPALTPASQVALTLRAVGGLTTAQIAAAFLVPEATMAQRISRAKQRIKATGIPFVLPPASERPERLAVLLHVLYLIFNEGYTATSGPDLHRGELTREAIRLARVLVRLLPLAGQAASEAAEAAAGKAAGEGAGLLALMLLTEARRPARTAPDGSLVPLAEQDRSRWSQDLIAEGVDLITAALASAPVGPYQIQAAIAAVHAEAAAPQDTDWPQILALYNLLESISPSPVIRLNRAVAVTMVDGPAAGLDLLSSLDADERMTGQHRLAAVRAHLLELAGDLQAARGCYQQAARATTSIPEQRYLESRAHRLTADRPAPAASSGGLADDRAG